VDDNGLGIDPRFKDRAFAMFERLHPDRKIPGTGVGLAIVSTAMERMGGARGVEPNAPHGSRFWIELPK
jgi:signal transduction histidine kinase